MSVSKQMDLTTHSNCFENADWELQLPAYQNDGVRHLVAVTAPA
jgi:hypothetical protein